MSFAVPKRGACLRRVGSRLHSSSPFGLRKGATVRHYGAERPRLVRRAATLPSFLPGQFFPTEGADSVLHTVTGLSHRYPARLRFRLLRDHDFQHTVSTRRFHVLGIRGVRQDEAAMEPP
jgi:hypothetical protein